VPGLGERNVGAGEYEFVELVNQSGVDGVDLLGVELSGGVQFDFNDSPIRFLAPGERLLVVSDQTAFESRYGEGLPIAGEFAGGSQLSDTGEMLSVESSLTGLIQSFEYDDAGAWPGRADGNGSTLVAVDLNGDYNSASNWRSSVEFGGSPGSAAATPSFDVIVNEVFTNSDLPQVDSIELFNAGGAAVEIGGWWLSDSNDDYFKYEIDAGETLAPGEYLVLDESDFNSGGGSSSKDFALSAFGDDVWLVAVDEEGRPTRFADRVEFDAAQTGVALGRLPNALGELFPLASPSPGAENGPHLVGDVVVSEVHYHPAAPTGGSLAIDQLEFVELNNRSGSVVDLSGWRLRGGVDFDMPAGTLVEAGQSLTIVSFDPASSSLSSAFRAAYQMSGDAPLAGPYGGVLDNGGESVKLLAPVVVSEEETAFRLVDRVIYDDDAPWPGEADGQGESLTRIAAEAFGDDPGSWQAQSTTPGSVGWEAAIAADFNADGAVDADDLANWEDGFGMAADASGSDGDADGDRDVDGFDFLQWQRQFGRNALATASFVAPNSLGAIAFPAVQMVVLDQTLPVTSSDAASLRPASDPESSIAFADWPMGVRGPWRPSARTDLANREFEIVESPSVTPRLGVVEPGNATARDEALARFANRRVVAEVDPLADESLSSNTTRERRRAWRDSGDLKTAWERVFEAGGAASEKGDVS
ncbi:MAG: lamin tail domain-containing protein, partial [Planctomycetota bacterium]